MDTNRFDLRMLHRSIDAERQHQGLAWTAIAGQVGVSVSTIRRFAEADDAEADGVLALVRWLGACPEDYIEGATIAEPLHPMGTGFVRIDPHLIADLAGEPTDSVKRTRMSIQQLAAAAQQLGRSVASLTRLSDV